MKCSVLVSILVMMASGVSAQEHHHHVEKKDTSRQATQKPTDMDDMEGMHDMKGQGSMMTHAFSRSLPMSRTGSGTSWLPDASPMYMYMNMKENQKGSWMLTGNVFLRFDKQDLFNKGVRGGQKVDAPNWLMAMYNRPVGNRGLLTAMAMVSLDRLTEGGAGYPLLFQTGETYNGNRLVDRQHPHDLFTGLTVGYSYMIDSSTDVFVYAGYPGEPAIGAPTFMHRISAIGNPDAPLGHHWQDATHITFGVGTLGFRYRQFKLEGSIFNGHEPDENRYDFDKLYLNSYSYRLSWNPSDCWALQFSQAFIKDPEIKEPGVDITRTTASVLYTKQVNRYNYWAHSLIWGLNTKKPGGDEHSVLYETHLQLHRQALYARYEWVQKPADELDLKASLDHRLLNVHALTLGYNHLVLPAAPLEVLAGVQATANFAPTAVQSVYGKRPIGFEVYLQFHPNWHH